MPRSKHRGDKRFAFIPCDLRYFRTHFVCQPMLEMWCPPPVHKQGTSYEAADFVSWMLRAPVVSARAKDALGPICGSLVEFLPFHAIKGSAIWAINVLSRDPRAPIFKTQMDSVVSVMSGLARWFETIELSTSSKILSGCRPSRQRCAR